MKITEETYIEVILELIPESANFLREKGIKCIACGEPVWGTLRDAAKEKNFNDEEIKKVVSELNSMI